MKNDRIIIAISGSKGVEWYRRTKVAEDYGNNIIHFADKLKDLCAQITD